MTLKQGLAKSIKTGIIKEYCDECDIRDCATCNYSVILEALSKNILSKTAISHSKCFLCPTCNKSVKEHHSYCHRCGQSIRWEE